MQLVLQSLPEIQSVEYLNIEKARQHFLEQADLDIDIASLPAEAFPASLEITVKDAVQQKRLLEITESIKRFNSVESIETYRDWFEQLGSLLTIGQWAAGILALLVTICVIAVIGNTIRLAVASRRDEIEILKLCGATDGFIRNPFIIEGVLQGIAASMSAILILLITYLSIRGSIESTISVLTGVPTAFLNFQMIIGMVFGAAIIGALGSALALRRYLIL